MTPPRTEFKGAILRLMRKYARSFAPPPRLRTSEWADTFRRLGSEASAEVGRWHTSRAEYQRGMMDALHEAGIHMVVFMTSAQVGKSEVLLNILARFMHLEPAPILMLQPTLELAEAFSKDRIAPMIASTPELSAKVSDPRSRDSGNTLLHKKYAGGHITLAGANSPASLASRPIRIVLADEVDRYPASAGAEGDPLSLASKRTATFRNRRIIVVSTPTVEGASRIQTAFKETDQRYFLVPCPDCDHAQRLVWQRIRYDEKNPKVVHYECENCGVLIPESRKNGMIEKGRWVATAPTNGKAGFHISELYSTFRKWSETVEDYLAARDNPHMLRAWWNTAMGEPYADPGEAPEWERLFDRRESFPMGTVPAGALVLTAGVDIQADRIEAQVIAWGRGRESWSVDYRVFPGDTEQADVWQALREYLGKMFPHASGASLPIARAAIDSGYKTSRVYEFVRGCNAEQVIAIKGVVNLEAPIASPKALDVVVTKGKRTLRRTLQAWRVGVSHLKGELYGCLRLPRPTEKGQVFPAGYCHFPEYDSEFFRQLTAEALVTEKVKKTGAPVRYWRLMRDRNEALDTWVYARAAAAHLGIDRFQETKWKQMEQELQVGVAPKPLRRQRIKWVEGSDDVVA